MADFTSWSDLVSSLKNSLANRDGITAEHRAPDGTYVKYRSVEEIKDLLAWAESKADADSASTGQATRRSYGKTVSSGTW